MDASRFDRLTRRIAGRTSRRTAVGSALAGLGLGAFGQLAPAQEATPGPTDGENPVFMFVQTFAAGRGEVNPGAGTPTPDGTPVAGGGARFLLTLEGHTGQTIYFSDRPDRIVGAAPTEQFLDGLGFTPVNPPNAALVGEFRTGQGVVVLELIDPVYDPERGSIMYGAEVLEGYGGENLSPVLTEQVAERLPAEFGPAALFIDDCPNYTTCYCEIWAKFNDQEVLVERYPLGPIPDGPYKACFGVDNTICTPCGTMLDALEQICTDKYSGICDAAIAPGA
jgi:hypothetical protein